MMTRLVPLEQRHLDDFSIEDTEGVAWFGIAHEAPDGRTLAIGVIWLHECGRVFSMVAGPVPRLAHRAALRLLAICREAGLEVWAECDPQIAGAERWLRRLGFEKQSNGDWKRG